MRLIIIGGVAAGSKAAAKARRQALQLEIIIYQDEAELSYSACGMPYVISGVIENPRSLIVRQADEFAKDGIQVFTRHRVLHIDTSHKQLTVKNLQTDTEQTVSYDCLLLATGARPILPKLEGIALRGVVTLRNYSDLERLQALLSTMQPKQAVIIGAGYIGLELAEAFQQRAIQTTLLEKSPQILPKFDAEIAALVRSKANRANALPLIWWCLPLVLDPIPNWHKIAVSL
jgi:CoA-dependent NAD(P)H sulfur oxidoreductase